MKKIVVILTVIMLLFTATACDESDQQLLNQFADELEDVIDLADDVTGQLNEKIEELESSGKLEELEGLLTELETLGEKLENVSNNVGNQTTENEKSVYDEWSTIVGYWNAAEGKYFLLDMEDSHTAYVGQGFHATENYREGRVIEISSVNQVIKAKVLFPEREATKEVEGIPATEVLFTIDYSDLEQDGKIRIQVDEDVVNQCMFAGNTFKEAEQTYFDNIGENSETERTAYDDFNEVVGYWNAKEGRYFILDMEDSHIGYIGQGFYDTSNYRQGRIIEISSENQVIQAKVLFPEREATEEIEGVPEQEVLFKIDCSDLEQDGKIRIKIEDEVIQQCMFAGNRFEEAYQTYLDNMKN